MTPSLQEGHRLHVLIQGTRIEAVGPDLREAAGPSSITIGLKDISRVRALAVESRDYLAARAGFSVNPVQPPPPRRIQDPYLRDYFASRERH